MTHPSDELAPASEPKPKYAPGVLIVKFKEPIADQLKAALVRGEPLHEVSLSPSLDALNAKYGLKEMRMLFRSFIVKDAGGSTTHIETMSEHIAKVREKFPLRAERSAPQYKGPDLTTFFRLRMDAKADMETVAADYGKDVQVEYAGPDYEATLCWQPNDYFYRPNVPGSWGQPYPDLWGIRKIRCGEAWDISKGSGVIIAVIDTGTWYRLHPGNPYYAGHPDLVSNLWINYLEYIGAPGRDDDGNGYIDDKYGYNFVYNSYDPEDSVGTDPMDFNGHGTHVAGTAAAVGNNVIGVIGVAPQAKVMTVKALTREGWGEWSWTAEAIEYAVDNGADVLNLSLGGTAKPPDVVSAIEYAWNSGCVIVAAAGNAGETNGENAYDTFPGNAQRTIAVSATEYNDGKAAYSNFGFGIDVAAPGSDVLSTRSAQVFGGFANQARWVDDPNDVHHGSIYVRADGTSMSTPHVAAVAALILSINPYLNPEEVRTCIRKSAVDLGQYGFDEVYGFGRLDARGAVERASSASNASQALILEPEDGLFWRLDDEQSTIDVYGIADSDYWNYYPHSWEVHYRPTHGPSGWTYVGSGSDRKPWYYGGYMGTIYLDDLPDGQYTVRLTVYHGSQPYYDYAPVLVCAGRRRLSYWAWEDGLTSGLFPMASAPVLAELDETSPGLEIFVGTQGMWRCFVTPTGGDYWRWFPGLHATLHPDGTPILQWYTLLWYGGAGSMCSASAADLDLVSPDPNLSPLEFVYGTEDRWDQDWKRLRAHGGMGWPEWWEDFPGQRGIRSSPAIADLLPDEHPEIVFGHGPTIYWLRYDGSVLWERYDPQYLDVEWSSAAIANVNADPYGYPEIAIGSQRDNSLHVLQWYGDLYRHFETGGAIESSPAVADILTDQQGYPGLEIVVGSNDGYIYCFSCTQGTTCWSYYTGGPVRSSPAIGDIDPSTEGFETVVGSDANKVLCLRADGTLLWEFQTEDDVSHSSPALGDLNPSSPGLEVAIGTLNGTAYVLNGGDYGSLFWVFECDPGTWGHEHRSTPNGAYEPWETLSRPQSCSPVIADINVQRAGLEMVLAPDDGHIYILNFPGTETGTQPWPMFHHDARHTGFCGP
ncbi:MAG: S8 family serine peptidase [bacterium]|nr:S8 family serine peptidase [bacterium]